MDTELPSEPRVRSAAACHLVALDAEHPGFRDRDYRSRRDAIAQLAIEHRRGERPPWVDYTAAEQQVWHTVWRELRPLHERFVCRPVLELLRKVRFDEGPIPQLAELDRLLRVASDFSMQPVAGLVAAGDFLAALGERVFLATQYVRHASAPLYTPEPDLVHEFVGHATTLLDPRFAELHAVFGRAAAGADPHTVARIERVYWFTVEYGVVLDGGAPRAVGAGLLSSAEELAQLTTGPRLLPWDLDAAARHAYDPTRLQGELFVAPSFEAMVDDTTRWLERQAVAVR